MSTPSAGSRRKHDPRFFESLENRVLFSGFSTSDDFQLSPGHDADLYYGAVASDALGDVYAAGEALDSAGAQHDVIRMKAAGAATWTTISDVQVPGGYSDLAVSPGGDLYVTGTGVGSGWIVQRMRRSIGETTFTTIDQPVFSGRSNCVGLALDAAGDVYAIGYGVTVSSKRTSVEQWIVRKQTGGTGAFATADAYRYSDADSYPNGVTVIDSGPAAGVYVVGESDATGHWLARRSADGGAHWSLVDDYQAGASPGDGTVARANALAGDTAGNVYVVGFAQSRVQTGGTRKSPTYSYTNLCTTRKGTVTAGGAWTWSVDDTFITAGRDPGFTDVSIDSAGSVYVAGMYTTQDNLSHSLVRRKAAGTWATADDFIYSGSLYGSESYSLVIDTSGDVFVGGYSSDASGVSHWIVRSTDPLAT